jgi:hypothetical protein
MADGKAQRVRITLRWIQIVDNMEAPWDAEGEFRFRVRVTANGKTHETVLPERGHWSISDHPGRNRVEGIDAVLFEGEPGQALVVEISAYEVDRVSDDDALTPYRREFGGSPSAWAGRYQPGDEGRREPEALPEWRLAYDIEVA